MYAIRSYYEKCRRKPSVTQPSAIFALSEKSADSYLISIPKLSIAVLSGQMVLPVPAWFVIFYHSLLSQNLDQPSTVVLIFHYDSGISFQYGVNSDDSTIDVITSYSIHYTKLYENAPAVSFV